MPIDPPLSREELTRAIEGRGRARRVPMDYHFWVDAPSFGPREAEVRAVLSAYPCDLQTLPVRLPDALCAPEGEPGYRWMHTDAPQSAKNGYDNRALLADMGELPALLADFPSPDSPRLIPPCPAPDGRYRLTQWWYCLFERHWSLRGMENALTDFYEYPEETHRLYDALTDFYIRLIERAHEEQRADGVFTSDDLGTQTSTFFSPQIFETFFLPRYARIARAAHRMGMHFWLHTCGNVERFLDGYARAGVDVLHPIQRYAMNDARARQIIGGRMCVWAGFDVQRVIPYGGADDVRAEVRRMMRAHFRPEGRLIVTAGNAIHADCSTPSLEALLHESLRYGKEISAR